jgi:hypothetical protein
MFLKMIKKMQIGYLTAALVLGFVLFVGSCSNDEDSNDSNQTPNIADYTIGNLYQTEGSVTAVTVTAKDGKSTGAVTVYYEGSGTATYAKSATLPTAAGTYAVTFDVAAAAGWNAASGLNAGTLIIIDPNLPIPLVVDYNISSNLNQTVGSVTAVIVTAKDGKSAGAVTVYYEGTGTTTYARSAALPTAAGTYAVTFDVAGAAGWNPAAALSAGTLVITDVESNTNYLTGDSALSWGTAFTPLTLGLTPGNNTTEINLNWYSSGAPAGKSAKVRFIRGTLEAGKELIEKDGEVNNASSGYTSHKVTVTGLKPGASYKYVISNDGSDWSEVYDFSVPAATGSFRFAVIADPQLTREGITTWVVDPNSRYPATGTTTLEGWEETMEKIVKAGVSFIASCGDQVDASAGNENEYTNFFTPDGLRSLPVAPVPGNHDNHLNYNYHYNWPNAQPSPGELATEEGRNYFYLYNNILFVVLNTAPYPNSANAAKPYVDRFDNTLKAAKTAHPTYDWLIVQHHKSTASVADHLADTDIQFYVEAGFERVMTEHKVDFVLAGHDHVYARSYPLSGKDGGKVSVPNKNQDGDTINTPTDPIYLTFTTASGLKYYAVAPDTTFNYNNTLYVKDNAAYPYLGDVTDAAGSSSTFFGSAAYLTKNYLPVSNKAYVQPYIPSYCIVEVNGKNITFKTYAIATRSGTSSGAAAPYSFNENIPYDTITVTK